MCGRAYETYTDEELYFQYLNKRPPKSLQFTPVYNLCPTQDSPVLRLVEGERQFDQMRWQLVPNWEPTFSTKLTTINAKSETVFDSPLFREIVPGQRCIVPLSGFYEWKAEGQRKRPFKIHLQSNAIMSVAGIWDTWRAGVQWSTSSGFALNWLLSTLEILTPWLDIGDRKLGVRQHLSGIPTIRPLIATLDKRCDSVMPWLRYAD